MLNFLLNGLSAPDGIIPNNKTFSDTDLITCGLIFIILVLMGIAVFALAKKYRSKPQDEENKPDKQNQPKSDE